LKSQNHANLDTNEFVGQAASYLIRLLESSSPNSKYWAICCITNLVSSVIVKVSRTKDKTQPWVFQKSLLTKASIGISYCYNSSFFALRKIKLSINIYLPLDYICGGASAFIYSCCETSGRSDERKVIKFYHNHDTGAETLRNEIAILNALKSDDKPKEVPLQNVLYLLEKSNEITKSFPFPLAAFEPLGCACSPFLC
jgi:hypothetical protein